MNTQALSINRYFSIPKLVSNRRHPLFDALEHITYGHLTLATPEGNLYAFSGPEHGPLAHLRLFDWQVLDDFIRRGEIGLAEAYVQGRWESENLADLLTFGLMNTRSLEKYFYGKPWYALVSRLRGMLQVNTVKGSRRNVLSHYDLGNDFYQLWLDKSMTYSCGLFGDKPQRTLEEAQAAKYERILRKLTAKPGQHILEIGCGWGGFAEAAARHGLQVTAITLSDEQANYAKKRMVNEGLVHLVDIQLVDYRQVSGAYDYIVSIGMFEHVGEAYWDTYMETLKTRLVHGGKAMVQSITLDDHIFETCHDHVGFIEQVIFPGGMLPSKQRFCEVASKAGLQCREMFSFGKDYVLTLEHWLARFQAHKKEVKALGYDDAFLRLWTFYLSSCIAAFASKRSDVMQAELTHPA